MKNTHSLNSIPVKVYSHDKITTKSNRGILNRLLEKYKPNKDHASIKVLKGGKEQNMVCK